MGLPYWAENFGHASICPTQEKDKENSSPDVRWVESQNRSTYSEESLYKVFVFVYSFANRLKDTSNVLLSETESTLRRTQSSKLLLQFVKYEFQISY